MLADSAARGYLIFREDQIGKVVEAQFCVEVWMPKTGIPPPAPSFIHVRSFSVYGSLHHPRLPYGLVSVTPSID